MEFTRMEEGGLSNSIFVLCFIFCRDYVIPRKIPHPFDSCNNSFMNVEMHECTVYKWNDIQTFAKLLYAV
jgi:hypothetical protein